MSIYAWVVIALIGLNQITFWIVVKLIQAEQPGVTRLLGKLVAWDYSPEGNFGKYYAALYHGLLWKEASKTVRLLIVFWYFQGISIFVPCIFLAM